MLAIDPPVQAFAASDVVTRAEKATPARPRAPSIHRDSPAAPARTTCEATQHHEHGSEGEVRLI